MTRLGVFTRIKSDRIDQTYQGDQPGESVVAVVSGCTQVDLQQYARLIIRDSAGVATLPVEAFRRRSVFHLPVEWTMTWEELETLHFFPSSATVSVLTADSIIINSLFTTAMNVKPRLK